MFEAEAAKSNTWKQWDALQLTSLPHPFACLLHPFSYCSHPIPRSQATSLTKHITLIEWSSLSPHCMSLPATIEHEQCNINGVSSLSSLEHTISDPPVPKVGVPPKLVQSMKEEEGWLSNESYGRGWRRRGGSCGRVSWYRDHWKKFPQITKSAFFNTGNM